jgi:tetratricopeptide (TPR) repeat protein
LTAPLAAQTQNPGNNPNAGGGRSGGAVSHSIRGKIFMPAGNLPEQRIRVVLELNTGGIAQETFSDSVGNFEFRSVSSNSYRVTVPTDNHTWETTQEMVEVYGNFARTFTVQLYLREKGREAFRPKEKILSVADMQDVPKAAKKAYEQGLKRTKEGKAAEAITHYQEALQAYPDYLSALNKLGEQYLQMNKLSEAQAALERAVAINGRFALARITLGMLLVSQGQYDQAIEHLEAANRQDDSFPMAHLNLGLALMSKEPPDLERAEKELTRAVEQGGRNLPYVRLHLFNLHYRRRELPKAAAQLEAYLKDAPGAPNAGQVRDTLDKVKKMLAQQAASAAKPPQ